MAFGDLLTLSGLTAFVILMVGLIKVTLPSFDSARFGAVTAVGIGVLAATAANLTSVGDVHLGAAEAIFLGILGGAAAAGLYDAGTGPRG